MQKQHFRLQNLVVTIAPMVPITRTHCPSGTCCGPPSALFACRFSKLWPPAPPLKPDDLRTILDDLRSKLDAEKQGLDVILETDSDKDAMDWRKVIEGAGLKHFKAEPGES